LVTHSVKSTWTKIESRTRDWLTELETCLQDNGERPHLCSAAKSVLTRAQALNSVIAGTAASAASVSGEKNVKVTRFPLIQCLKVIESSIPTAKASTAMSAITMNIDMARTLVSPVREVNQANPLEPS
jgi:hypothetical protein